MQTQSDTEVIANIHKKGTAVIVNVRKKGRPRVFDHVAGFEAAYRPLYAQESYRSFYEHMRIVNVHKKLMTIMESSRVSADLKVQRWPWLLGRVVQKTVLLQFFGLHGDVLAECCDLIEGLHNKGLVRNAREATSQARTLRIALTKEEVGTAALRELNKQAPNKEATV